MPGKTTTNAQRGLHRSPGFAGRSPRPPQYKNRRAGPSTLRRWLPIPPPSRSLRSLAESPLAPSKNTNHPIPTFPGVVALLPIQYGKKHPYSVGPPADCTAPGTRKGPARCPRSRHRRSALTGPTRRQFTPVWPDAPVPTAESPARPASGSGRSRRSSKSAREQPAPRASSPKPAGSSHLTPQNPAPSLWCVASSMPVNPTPRPPASPVPGWRRRLTEAQPDPGRPKSPARSKPVRKRRTRKKPATS